MHIPRSRSILPVAYLRRPPTGQGHIPAQPVFSLAGLPGLQLAFDASSVTTTSGGKVSAWTDSAHGTLALPINSASAPVVVPGAVNGLPALRFAGTAGCGLTFNNQIVQSLPSFSITAVLARTGGGTNYPRIFLNGLVNESVSIFYLNTLTNMDFRFGSGSDLTGHDVPLGTYCLMEWNFDGTARGYRQNGVSVASDQPGSGPPAASSSFGFIAGDSSSGFEGLLAALVLCKPALGPADALALRTYLQTRYGTPTR